MQKSLGIFLALATLSAAHAQYSDPASQQSLNSSQSAPVVQAYAGGTYRTVPNPQIFDLQPSAGLSVRSDTADAVQTVASSSALTELRIAQGRANVTVHHPADHSEVLIDLPGGQVSLLKDGLYTFNAQTNTVRVLHGEAEVGATSTSKGTKVKETQQLTFIANNRLKSVNAYPYELTADLLRTNDHGDGAVYRGYGRGYDGAYPYYAGLYPYGYGYSPYGYGYGYPFSVGLGFGYYGGYRGGFGGYRGGFGGFRR